MLRRIRHKEENLSALTRVGKEWCFLNFAVKGKLALRFTGRYEGCLRRKHWLARDAGTANPSWLKGGENILAELKKGALQKELESLDPNLHLPSNGK